MMTRHQRRKAAKAKQATKLIALAQAERARQVNETVKANLSRPIERHYPIPISSVYGGLTAARADGIGVGHHKKV